MDQSITRIDRTDSRTPDIEQVLALQPDLFITQTFFPDVAYQTLGYQDQDSYQQFAEIVPVLALSARTIAGDVILRYETLAASLGSDLETPAIVGAKAEFAESVARFRKRPPGNGR
ncbi:MAG: ABC transporter substrate-binding protein [Thermomicrobiales bacterium]